MYAPLVVGISGSKMNQFFRIKKAFAQTDARRYPVGRYAYRVNIAFGKDVPKNRNQYLTINTIDSIRKSSNKIVTKEIWRENDINCHATFARFKSFLNPEGYFEYSYFCDIFDFPDKPVLIKTANLSRGRGMELIQNADDLGEYFRTFFRKEERTKNKIFIESFFKNTREFRIFCSHHIEETTTINILNRVETFPKGVFLAYEKVNRSDSENNHWARNHNPNISFTTSFARPSKWEEMCEQAVKAVKVLGLDFGFIDCLYNDETQEYCFCESGSNPGIKGEESLTAKALLVALPKIIIQKNHLRCVQSRRQ